ncbi:hypothetical protein EVAR_62530_1, partial [Eumeta japonica]
MDWNILSSKTGVEIQSKMKEIDIQQNRDQNRERIGDVRDEEIFFVYADRAAGK